jgi:hypothetical protein
MTVLTIFTIPTIAQTTTPILTTVNSHLDGWKTKSLNNNTSQTQHHKDGKTCMTLMTAWCHTRFLRPKPDAHRMYAQDQVVIHTVRM